jgi:hypothetical protein
MTHVNDSPEALNKAILESVGVSVFLLLPTLNGYLRFRTKCTQTIEMKIFCRLWEYTNTKRSCLPEPPA